MPAKELVEPNLPGICIRALLPPVCNLARPVALAAPGFECGLAVAGVANACQERCHQCTSKIELLTIGTVRFVRIFSRAIIRVSPKGIRRPFATLKTWHSRQAEHCTKVFTSLECKIVHSDSAFDMLPRCRTLEREISDLHLTSARSSSWAAVHVLKRRHLAPVRSKIKDATHDQDSRIPHCTVHRSSNAPLLIGTKRRPDTIEDGRSPKNN